MSVEAENITIETGEHIVQFYDCESDLVTCVVRYLLTAARAGEVAVVVATEEHLNAFEAEMKAAGLDTADARLAGTFVALDAALLVSRFVADGRVDAVGFHAVVGDAIRNAVATGRPVRAYGEMVALLWDAGYVAAAIELEELWNDLGRELEFSLFCAYPSESVSAPEHADAFNEVCHLHSAVLPAAALLPAPAFGHRHVAERRPFVGEESQRYEPELIAPREARHSLVEALHRAGHGAAFVDDAALVVSELATNAVVHARTPFTVAVSVSAEAVRITVRDESPTPPVPRHTEPTASSGRGLSLVATLASCWGAEVMTDGKVVWAELHR